MAGVKAISFDSESLEELIIEVADSYGLSERDRQILRPAVAIDTQQGLAKVAGYAASTPNVAAGLKLANAARKSGSMFQTMKAYATDGLEAAAKVADSSAKAVKAVASHKVVEAASKSGIFGKLTRKAGENAGLIGLALKSAYAVGTSGFFMARGRQFNLECYELVKARLPDTNALPPAAADDTALR